MNPIVSLDLCLFLRLVLIPIKVKFLQRGLEAKELDRKRDSEVQTWPPEGWGAVGPRELCRGGGQRSTEVQGDPDRGAMCGHLSFTSRH